MLFRHRALFRLPTLSRGFLWGSGGGGGPSRLAPNELVTAWMDDPSLVSPSLSLWRRSELFLSLRLLPGLNLKEFLRGAAVAYPVVCSAMYTRDWDALAPLVAPRCLEAMQEAMDGMAEVGQRVSLAPDGSDLTVLSATLARAQVLQTSDEVPQGSCLLHVKYTVRETYSIIDCHSNAPMPPFDGSVREQESTWVFEGIVRPEGEGDREEEEPDWKVHGIV